MVLGLQAAFDGAARRSTEPPGPGLVQRGGQSAAKAVEGDGPVAQLGSLVVRRHLHDRAQPPQQPIPLGLVQGGRTGNVERQLGPGGGPVGVLAAGSARRREPPRQLVEADGAIGSDLEHLGHTPSLTALGAATAPALAPALGGGQRSGTGRSVRPSLRTSVWPPGRHRDGPTSASDREASV
jgi:hypothetical protein